MVLPEEIPEKSKKRFLSYISPSRSVSETPVTKCLRLAQGNPNRFIERWKSASQTAMNMLKAQEAVRARDAYNTKLAELVNRKKESENNENIEQDE